MMPFILSNHNTIDVLKRDGTDLTNSLVNFPKQSITDSSQREFVEHGAT